MSSLAPDGPRRSTPRTLGVGPPDGGRPLDAVEANRLSDRRVFFALCLMIVAIVFLQRFAVPGIGTAVCLPIVLAVVMYLAIERVLILDVLRMWLYLGAVGACCGAALVSTVSFREEWSLKSLLLLIVLYAPFCFRLRAEFRFLYRPLLEFFNRLMVIVACVALGQWLAQLAGWRYRDLLDFVPRQLLVQGYNTSYPLHYGSPVWKSNAVVFLEPSFCAQFLAVAIIAQLLLGGTRWRIPLYFGALLSTVTGTGILLLVIGLIVLAVRGGLKQATRTLLLWALVGALVYLSPIGQMFAGRIAEPSEANSSGNTRFVAPYTGVFEGLERDTATLLLGRGPGVVARPGVAYFNSTRVQANHPVIPKLAAEYGLIAAILFTCFMVVAITAGTPTPTLAAMMLLVYFALSGSLLQPQTVYMALIVTSLFAAGSSAERDLLHPNVGAPTLVSHYI
jgi:hypothetical protein